MFKKNINLNRLALVALMAIGCTISAFADNKIVLGDGGPIAIKPGETKVVEVNFTNDDEFGALQFDMDITSSKIEIVEGSLEVNDDRASRDLFITTLYHMDNGKWRYSVLTRPNAINIIPGHEGALGTFKIKAADDFSVNDDARIYFSTSSGGDASGNKILISTPVCQAVTPVVANFTVNEAMFSIKPGETHTVTVAMANEVEIYGLQTDITLPKGLTFGKVTYSERVSGNFFSSSEVQKDGSVRLILGSLPLDKIKDNAGNLFSFNVVAAEDFVTDANSVITFSNTYASNDKGVEYVVVTDEAKVVVNSLKMANDAAYTRLVAEVEAIQKDFEAVKAQVAEECKDVAESMTEAAAAVQAQIDAIKADLDKKNAAYDLTEESTLDAEAVAAAKAAIEKYLADAKAAQDEFIKKAANEAAYKRLSEELATVQARFDEVKSIIDEKYSNVAGQFVGVEMTIQLEINKVSKELKTQYENIELTEESQLDVQVLKDTIEQLLDDAKKASETAGINGILNGADGTECIGVYTLDGTEVNAPVKGQTYVVRYADGKTMKVFIR